MLWTLRFVHIFFFFFWFSNIFGIDAVNRPLEVLPKYLNRIEVKTLTGPLQKAHFLLLKPFCSFNSVLWVVVWLHHQNFCWTSVGGQMAWKMCTVCSIISWKCFNVCVTCLNRKCLSIIVSFMINTHRNHILFPAAVYQANKSHNVGQHQRC